MFFNFFVHFFLYPLDTSNTFAYIFIISLVSFNNLCYNHNEQCFWFCRVQMKRRLLWIIIISLKNPKI